MAPDTKRLRELIAARERDLAQTAKAVGEDCDCEICTADREQLAEYRQQLSEIVEREARERLGL